MWGPSAKIRPLLSQVWGHSLVNEIRFIHLPPSQVFIKRISCVLIAALALVISACSISLAEDIAPPPGAQQQPVPSGESLPVSGPHYPLVPPNPETERRSMLINALLAMEIPVREMGRRLLNCPTQPHLLAPGR
jgi:hypothetical protein